jgi:hypothetical protein
MIRDLRPRVFEPSLLLYHGEDPMFLILGRQDDGKRLQTTHTNT